MADVSGVTRASTAASRAAQANLMLQRAGLDPSVAASLQGQPAGMVAAGQRFAAGKTGLPSVLNEQNILGWDAKMRGNAIDLSNKLDAERAIAQAEIDKNNAIAEAQAKARKNAWKSQLASVAGIGAGVLMPYLIPGIAGLAAGAAGAGAGNAAADRLRNPPVLM